MTHDDAAHSARHLRWIHWYLRHFPAWPRRARGATLRRVHVRSRVRQQWRQDKRRLVAETRRLAEAAPPALQGNGALSV